MELKLSDGKKPERTLEQIQQDYQNLCLKAGHTQYQVVTLQKELSLMNDSLRDLNIEAATLAAKKAEADKAAAEASAPAPEAPSPSPVAA